LASRPEKDEASDAALLDRFLSTRDETAFTALVNRHGPLVFRVCRRVLGDVPDVEDAFQATFLVLARKAASIRAGEVLTAWLHGVAQRVALKARSARIRQLHGVQPLAATPADPRSDPLREVSARELLAMVDEEVRRLPEVYRLPVILCCLEGKSQEEAAHQLGWTSGSVKGRLERGRVRLHKQLVRRGLTLSAVLAAAEFSRDASSATPVARLAAPTVQGAMAFATRQTPAAGSVSTAAAGLARDAVKSMALAKLKMAAALLLVAGLLAVGWAAYRGSDALRRAAPELQSSSSPSPDHGELAAPANEDQNEKGGRDEEADARIEVSGRVLDPRGRPLAGARLYVGYAPRRNEPDAIAAHQPIYPLRAASGSDGGFGFTFARSELDERYLDASRPVVIAEADGFGLDWAEIRGSAATLRLRLVEDFPLEGRLLDAQCKPVAGAKASVLEVSSYSAEGLTRYLQDRRRASGAVKSCRGPLPGRLAQVTTAADGRFRLTGLGRDRLVTLRFEGPAPLPSGCVAATRPSAAVPDNVGRVRGVPFEQVATVPVLRSIRGVVRDKATGQAVDGVKMSLRGGRSSTRTDKDGRYELRVSPEAQGLVVLAQPQNGQPYFAAAARLPNTPDPAPLNADFELIGGIPLRGRVTDQATGKPPKRAVVEYYPLYPNAHSSVLTRLEKLQAVSSAILQADGAYSLTVLPGPGVVLVVASPRDSYAVARLDDRELANLFGDDADHGGGSWLYTATGGNFGAWRRCIDRYNALTLIHPDEKAKSLTLDVTVQAAHPLRGTVIGPDGQPLRGVRVCGLTSMPDAEMLEGPSFLVEGLNPQRTRELSFHHQEKGLGKVLTIRGDETNELTVQLEPCGEVIGRVVNRAGKPVPGVSIRFGRADKGLDAKAETDRRGRFRAALVPGFEYQWRLPTQRTIHVLTVESGKTKDLGDLLLGD
jgi:RNA polymerase sigma factor (sigma-70 family)